MTLNKFLSPWSVLVLALALVGCAAKSGSSHSSKYSHSTNPPLFEEEFEAQRKGELPEFELPTVRNAKVETWLNYFQGRGSKWFRIWMERSGRYIPFMKRILREHGLPEDLVYLAMIESGFSARAYSRARAVGYWQFMRATGKMYGLKVDFWVDERRDPEKATIAAARHLKDLYDQFQDWKLAAAAYNAGAGKVSRAIRRYKTEDFWDLAKSRYLAAETRNYVPKLIAAAIIARDPAKYGFDDIEFQEPMAFEKVMVTKPVSLRRLAEKTNVNFDDLWYLNPELNHAVTPPNAKKYEIRVPAKKSEVFMAAIENLEPEEMFQYATHQVRRGDTISAIGRRYNVPQAEVMSLNNIRSSRHLKVGQVLLLPIPAGAERPSRQYADRTSPKPGARRSGGESSPQIRSVAASTGEYIVQSGDSLWSISRNTGVSVQSIREANGLRSNSIRAGQRLVIPGAFESKKQKAFRPEKKVVHIVRRGETLSAIAERYGVTVRAIKNQNRLRQSTIHPGRRLSIPQT